MFILIGTYYHDGDVVLGVYSSVDTAESAWTAYDTNTNHSFYNHRVVNAVLDAPVVSHERGQR